MVRRMTRWWTCNDMSVRQSCAIHLTTMPISRQEHAAVWFRFDKFWFFLLLSRLLTRSWQVSGQTLVEGIWLVAVSQSRWFLNCNHSRVITMIIIAIAVSQTRLRYNVDNVDGRQWLPDELHITWPSICQVLDRYLPGTCQVLARYMPGTCHVPARHFLGTCHILDMSWPRKVGAVQLPSWLVSREGEQ